jgi:hypothetical protein
VLSAFFYWVKSVWAERLESGYNDLFHVF